LLATARFVTAARTQPAFELRDLGAFPGLVAGGEQAVVGEVYEVDAATMTALDDLEDHPTFYLRTRIVLEGGLEVWTYLLPRAQVEGCPIIASGNWRAR
jgi:gamma-glutamylaminecyclotransferase